MWKFQTGDLIAKQHPNVKNPLQIGIVIAVSPCTFTVKWTSFNKEFFMEKEEDIFAELNNSFLLDTVTVSRNDKGYNLSLLNSNYSDVRQTQKATY